MEDKLKAEIERLRELVIKAFFEGADFGREHYITETASGWMRSDARKVLRKEGLG